MPKNTAIIGRVAVKVLPDTDDFRDRAQRQLDAIERELNRKPLQVKVKPVIDQTGLVAEVKAAQKRAQEAAKDITIHVNVDNVDSLRNAANQLQSELNKLDMKPLKVGLDKNSLQRELSKIQQKIKDKAVLNLRVDWKDQSSLERAIAQIDAELAKLSEKELKVKLDRASLEKARAELAARLERAATVTIKADTSDLKSLEAGIAQLDQELSKLRQVEFTAHINEASLQRQRARLLKFKEEIEAQAQLDATIKLRNDQANSRLVLAEIQKALDEIKLSPHIDKAKLPQIRADLEQMLISLNELGVKIEAELDPLAKAKLKYEFDALSKSLDSKVAKINVEARDATFAAKMVELTRDRTADIIVNVNKTSAAVAAGTLARLSGARIVQMKINSLGELLSGLDVALPKIAAVGLGIVGLGAAGVNAAANLFSLSSSLASIAGAGFALPGIMGGFAVGLGATIAAFKDFNKQVPQAKGYMSELQNIVSTNFWQQQGGYIQGFIDGVMPNLRSGLKETGTQLGGFFSQLAYGLNQRLTPALPGMFAALNASIYEAAKSGTGLANIIAILGTVGSSYLPRLAQFFTDIVYKFSNFLMAAQNDGSLTTWINTGITMLTTLGNVLGSILHIFGAIATAATAAGGSTLTSLAATLDRIQAFVESPAGQGALTNVFSAAASAISNLVGYAAPGLEALFTALGGVIQQILPQVGAALGVAIGAIGTALSNTAVMDGLVSMFSALSSAVVALAPAFGPLAQVLAAIMPVIGTLATAIVPILVQSIQGLAPVVTTLTPIISELITLLGGALLQILGVIEPILPILAQAFVTIGTALMSALAPILPIIIAAFQQIVSAIVPLIPLLIGALVPIFGMVGAALAEVAPLIANLITQIAGLIAQILPVLIPVLQLLAAVFLGAIVGAIKGVINVVGGIIAIFQGIIDFIVGVFTGNWSMALNGILSILTGILDVIVGAFQIWWNVGILGFFGKAFGVLKNLWNVGWTAIKDFLAGILGGVSGTVSGAIVNIVSFFIGLPGRIVGGVSGAFGAVTGFFASIPGRILGAIGDLGGILSNAGRTVIDGFISGISSAFGKVQSKLKSLTDLLPDWKGPAPVDKVILKGAGQLVIQGFIDGLESQYGAVKKSLGGFTDDLATTDIASALAPSVTDIAKQINGISAASYDAELATSGARVLIYNAAENNSLDSEEDFFKAASRARGSW